MPRPPEPAPTVIVAATTGRISGVDVFSTTLVRGLTDHGFRGRIVLTDPHGAVPDHLPLPGDVQVETLSVRPRARWPERWRAMASFLEERAPCVYVPNYDWRYSCVSPTLPDDVAIVGIVHSDDPRHYEHAGRLGHTWNAVVAVSREVAARTAVLDASLAPRLVTIPYGVPVPRTAPPKAPPDGPLRLVYAGRLVEEQKRVLDLPRVVAAALRAGVPVELSIAGAGVDRGRLEAACGDLVARGAIRFLGTLTNEDVLATFERRDAVLLTSSYEGLPVSLLEAMGRACVPVVTHVESGVAEVVRDGANGFLVPIGDVDAFANRLARLHRDPLLRARLAAAAHATVSRDGYDAPTMVRRYAELFARVLRESRSGSFVRPRGPVLPPVYLSRGRRLKALVEGLSRKARVRLDAAGWSR